MKIILSREDIYKALEMAINPDESTRIVGVQILLANNFSTYTKDILDLIHEIAVVMGLRGMQRRRGVHRNIGLCITALQWPKNSKFKDAQNILRKNKEI